MWALERYQVCKWVRPSSFEKIKFFVKQALFPGKLNFKVVLQIC